tara:strand:- start:1430 stop:1621 length:192 start_codon:yes stop_codon:yes gene_type:complete
LNLTNIITNKRTKKVFVDTMIIDFKWPKRILAQTIGERSVKNYRGLVNIFHGKRNVCKSSKQF